MSKMNESPPDVGVEERLLLDLEEYATDRILDGAPVLINDDGGGVSIEDATDAQLAQYAYNADVLRKQLDEYLKVIKSNLHQVKMRIGARLLEQHKLDFTQQMDDGVNVKFKLSSEEKVSIKKDRQSDAFLWLAANGMAPIIKETVHPATLVAQMNAYLNRFNFDVDTDEDDAEIEIPDWVDSDDPDAVEEYVEAMKAKKYLNTAADNYLQERIEHLEHMQEALAGMEFDIDPPEELFNRYLHTTSKISYRR